MTWYRTAHLAETEGSPRPRTRTRTRTQPQPDAQPQPEASAGSGGTALVAEPEPHAAELMLAGVYAEGLPALVRVLLAARNGDRNAAGMRVGALLRALPGTGWFTAHDLIRFAGITEATRVGELDQTQRSSLTRNLARTLPPPESGAPARTPGPASEQGPPPQR